MLVQLSIPNTILNGKTTITTAGTRVVLGNGQCLSVTIRATATNTGNVYVGNTSVASGNGFALAAGDTVSMDISNLNIIWLDADTSGSTVTYIAVNY